MWEGVSARPRFVEGEADEQGNDLIEGTGAFQRRTVRPDNLSDLSHSFKGQRSSHSQWRMSVCHVIEFCGLSPSAEPPECST